MQLTSDKNIRLALATATGFLLGGSAAPAEAGWLDRWSFDTQLLYYNEPDRVTAVEPVLSARWDRGDDEFLNIKLTVDSLTGASASGATPSARAQTYTTPSGHDTYQVGAGETPLDPTFLDTRIALNLGWEKPLSQQWKMNLGANVSNEYDYRSIALNGGVSRDFNQKNSTFALGLSVGLDQVDPVGGIPRPLAAMSPRVPNSASPLNRLDARDDKSVYDVLLGFTQVIDRRSLVQINYSFGRSDGYLSDPYKLVSVVGASGANAGEPVAQLYESRPDARTKQSLFLAYKRRTRTKDVFDLSYRYHWDDWEVRSHTVDLRYRWDWGGKGYLQPHLRFYQQSAAEFYTRFLVAGAPLPAFASADYRLGELTGQTVGFKYGHPLPQGREWNVKLEYYLQTGDAPAQAPGPLAGFDLFPDVDAVMVQFGYTF